MATKNFTRFNTPAELDQYLKANPDFSAEVIKKRDGDLWQHCEWYNATSLPFDYAWKQETRECTMVYESREAVDAVLLQVDEDDWTPEDRALAKAVAACDFTSQVLVIHDGYAPEAYPRESITRSYDVWTYELVAA